MKQTYNRLTEEMNLLNISKEEKIELLKSRIVFLEIEAKRKQVIERIFFLGFISVLIGLFLIVLRVYLVGLLFIIGSFLFLSFKMISFAHVRQEQRYQNDKEKLNHLLKLHSK